MRAVDLDLDVVEGLDREVWVDDEDEFAEHRVELGYPREVVDLAAGDRATSCSPRCGTSPAVRRVGRARGSTCCAR